jgi:hypothetical protein
VADGVERAVAERQLVRHRRVVDYRLAREAVVRDYRSGRVSRPEICDAHPELLRAARNLGEASEIDCPICEHANVVFVSYAFGPRLPPGGRCVGSPAELETLSRRASESACYVVEVCPACAWNHLARMVVLGGRGR